MNSSEKTNSILGDRWWPQAVKQEADTISKKQRNERPAVGGVSSRSRNGAPSREGRVVNGKMTEANNK